MNVIETERQIAKIREEVESKFFTVLDDLKAKEVELARIKKEIEQRDRAIDKSADYVIENLDKNIDKEKLIRFFKKPYFTKPLGKNKILVAVPKYETNFQVGWLVGERDEFFEYELNQYSNWFGDIPEELSRQIEWPQGLNAVVENDIIKFNPQEKDKIKYHLGSKLADFTDSTARITRGNTFEIITKIIESGQIPFGKNPVQKQDLRMGEKRIKLLPHQMGARKLFQETGAIGVFLPTGGGKSFIAMDQFEDLKGPHLLVTYGTSLVEQWKWYIEEYIPHVKNDIQIVHYQSAYNLTGDYTLTVFDEAHRLPAPTFSRFSTIKTKYRMGLSASPFREDGNEKYIVALTGHPWGTNWPKYMESVGRKYHPIFVHVVETQRQKMGVVRTLFDPRKKTVIFSDSLELGSSCANSLGIPFVNGESKDRIATIQENKAVVLSRVGDMGISIKDLERIIEIDFQFGSRQQEIQRTGRLMHSQAQNTRHDIIMTQQEFNEYGKRLWILQEKGFKIKIVN